MLHRRKWLSLGLLLFLNAWSLHAQVSFERLLRASDEPQNWLTYSGNYLLNVLVF